MIDLNFRLGRRYQLYCAQSSLAAPSDQERYILSGGRLSILSADPWPVIFAMANSRRCGRHPPAYTARLWTYFWLLSPRYRAWLPDHSDLDSQTESYGNL